MIETKLQELEILLKSREEGLKRNGAIEKKQIEILNEVVCELRTEFSNLGVQIDTNPLRHIKDWDNQWYIKRDGRIVNKRAPGRNSWFDSKTFDAIIPITIKGVEHILYFIMKGVDGQGGHQGNVKQEIVLYIEWIERNTDENTHFIFQLDGEYLSKEAKELESTDKYTVTSSYDVKDTIRKYISSHLG